jgi:hypothetical protein
MVSKTKEDITKDATVTKVEPKTLKCGIVMPIASMSEELPSEHWSGVKSIIIDAVDSIDSPQFEAALVSDGDDVGVIHKRIVQGVYHSDIVVCDVSGKNPNVMFELGMRLAFDKPTVIIKDDATGFMFDTGVIEHLTYPRDLRFHRIIAFKELLAKKVLATYAAATSDPEHSTFLKSFATLKAVELGEKEVPAQAVILDMLSDVQKQLRSMQRSGSTNISLEHPGLNRITIDLEGVYDLVSKAESLLACGPDGWKELSKLQGQLTTLYHASKLPPSLSHKVKNIIDAIPTPRASTSDANLGDQSRQ